MGIEIETITHEWLNQWDEPFYPDQQLWRWFDMQESHKTIDILNKLVAQNQWSNAHWLLTKILDINTLIEYGLTVLTKYDPILAKMMMRMLMLSGDDYELRRDIWYLMILVANQDEENSKDIVTTGLSLAREVKNNGN